MRHSQHVGVTIGVEEEFLLVDPVTGLPVAAAADVLAAARAAGGTPALHAELLGTQVEAASGVCRSLAELGAQVRDGRRVLAAAAADRGLRLVASGVPVLDGSPPARTPGPRFDEMHARFTTLVADYQACGCHVHVGVPDRETGAAVLNHVAPWLPTLLALSANSALRDGRDHGHASLRMVDQSRFPGSGLPPWFSSAADYDRQVARLVDCGVLVDDRMTFWLARCSPHLPTVELRAADTVIEPWEAVLQAALSRALVRTALAELAVGREGPRLDPQLAAAAVWAAARYGLRGRAVDPVLGAPTTAVRLVDRLVAWVEPALREMDDLDRARAAIVALRGRGTGADRQRAAVERGQEAVLDAVTARVWETTPSGNRPGSRERTGI
ncbi:carboxylate-amine ligase [Actinokineospora iranica]|uniref:Putative glutamate--cysteine ligase 2 n=1 Tax=Actinokineospora iranica TaxID=1271860 RepID=A0A1G6RZY4_9PSEU|nr:glutamate--cysteine ligase [Actinokineospora iranica]SDD10169.1 carboxylate-amine ligase [Actinokineospora iranica]